MADREKTGKVCCVFGKPQYPSFRVGRLTRPAWTTTDCNTKNPFDVSSFKRRDAFGKTRLYLLYAQRSTMSHNFRCSIPYLDEKSSTMPPAPALKCSIKGQHVHVGCNMNPTNMETPAAMETPPFTSPQPLRYQNFCNKPHIP